MTTTETSPVKEQPVEKPEDTHEGHTHEAVPTVRAAARSRRRPRREWTTFALITG